MMSCTPYVVLVCGTMNRSEWPLVRVVLVYQQGCTLCGTSSLSGYTLVCSVVAGVAVAWLWHCLGAGILQWETWRLHVGLPQPYWCCLFCWSHMLDANSRVGRTKVIYHCALMVVGKRLTLRSKKTKGEFSFLVILSMWLSQFKLWWIFNPRYLAESVWFSTWPPWMVYSPWLWASRICQC